MKKILLVLKLFLVNLLFLFSLVYAETEVITYDYKDDFISYSHKVAQLNQMQFQGNVEGKKRSVIQLVSLLCKSDGRKIDFSLLSPSYIISGPRNCFTLFFSSEELCLKAVAHLKNTEGIIYAELDVEVHANGTGNEGFGSSNQHFHSWGASRMNIGEYLDYVKIWGNGSASVAVIDSGVFPHSLIQGKLISSGYDYVDNDEDSTNDLFGHGTNVAGIIADCTFGAPVYIYPIRVLNSAGRGKMSNVINAVYEAKTKGVTIINLSLESTVMSDALDEAVLDAVSSGVIVVVAAGNSSVDTSEVCPAHITNPGVIVVGAAEDNSGSYSIASYSNYGASVDVYTFGTDISCCSISGGFSNETGTSMAAPHVTAFCALLHLIHPSLSPAGTEQRIRFAAGVDNKIMVPILTAAIPKSLGFHLSHVCIGIGESLRLPIMALPESSRETIQYCISDENLLTMQNGTMTGIAAGTTLLTVSCTGIKNEEIIVDIVNQSPLIYIFPSALTVIGDEAFANNAAVTEIIIPNGIRKIGMNAFEGCSSLRKIYIPNSVEDLEDNTFSEAVILCTEESAVHAYAEENILQYVLEKEN